MRRLLFIIILLLTVFPAAAQDKEVYVTTRDYSALRAGPGFFFAQITVAPPETTMPAVGRSSEADWIQVQYGKTRGWIAARLLVWSGDMMGLPLDGVDPARFARLSGPTYTVTKTMQIHAERFAGPGERIEFPVESAEVEITGRLGSGESYWLQFWYQGQYYWLGAWNLHLVGTGAANFRDFPDGAYTYPYGRVLGQIVTTSSKSQGTLNTISSLWQSLSFGQSISCNFIPNDARPLNLAPSDLNGEPIFIPATRALDTAVQRTNAAIQKLRAACKARASGGLIPPETVQAALDDIATARVNFQLTQTLLPPLSNRDPGLGNQD